MFCKILGHKLTGMLAVYDQYDYPEQQEAADKWAQKLYLIAHQQSAPIFAELNDLNITERAPPEGEVRYFLWEWGASLPHCLRVCGRMWF